MAGEQVVFMLLRWHSVLEQDGVDYFVYYCLVVFVWKNLNYN